jgi:hypothetical protein
MAENFAHGGLAVENSELPLLAAVRPIWFG